MTWGNGKVTITFFGIGNRFEIDISDPDGVGPYMVREIKPGGQLVKNLKAGNGKCETDANVKILATKFDQANRLKVSYMDCQTSPAGEVWLLDPTPAASDPEKPKDGVREPKGTPLQHDDFEKELERSRKT